LDFRFLQHSIKFGSAERTTLTIDPSNWDKIDKETARKTGKSELISFFYRSSNNAPDENYIQSTVRYGMLSLPPHSLRVVSHGGIPIHGDAIGFSEWLDDEDLSDASDRIVDSDYELQAFRYGDDGKQAFRPDFIIASQDGVDEQALRQAEYFQVPVFVIPKHHVETKEDRVQPIKKQIEEYIQKSVKRNSERFPEEDSMEYEQTLRQLATSTNQEGWSRRQKAIHSELYSLVQQLESQE
ncbi:hypothetical protein J5500_02980, partial [Candidatus Saccharibacteria bacterium]|nr:hypothetical protein [Candidatus Saccharibacteria bacterium]